jgi:putative Ca2+/H+ antiporter (TMEM165/GDT1 family)
LSLLTIFFITFGLIFTAELGDKTQLMVFTLALRYGGRSVLAGAFLAFALLSEAPRSWAGVGELLSPVLITHFCLGIHPLRPLHVAARLRKNHPNRSNRLHGQGS